MDHKAFLLKHGEKEAPATRQVIGRIPEDRSDFRADPKARTAREIAWLIVHEEAALVDGLERGAFQNGLKCRHLRRSAKLWRNTIANMMGSPADSQPSPDCVEKRICRFWARGHEGDRVRNGMGIPTGSDPPPWPALDLLAPYGSEGAGHLRTKRRRVDVGDIALAKSAGVLAKRREPGCAPLNQLARRPVLFYHKLV